MASGKAAIVARTVWYIDLGLLCARCLREPDGSFIVQARTSKGWDERLASGTDPWELLRRLTASAAARASIELASRPK